jgi:hypothetical protein
MNTVHDDASPLYVKNTFLHIEKDSEELNNDCFAMLRQHTAPAHCFQRQLSSISQESRRRVSFEDDVFCKAFKGGEPEEEPIDVSPIEALVRQVSELSNLSGCGRQISNRGDLEEFCREVGSFARQETEQNWPVWKANTGERAPATEFQTKQEEWNFQGTNYQGLTDVSSYAWHPSPTTLPPWQCVGYPYKGGVPEFTGSSGSDTTEPLKAPTKTRRKAKSLITLAQESQSRQEQKAQSQPQQQQQLLGQILQSNGQLKKKPAAAKTARFCPFCGAPVQSTFKFCQSCGSEIASVLGDMKKKGDAP